MESSQGLRSWCRDACNEEQYYIRQFLNAHAENIAERNNGESTKESDATPAVIGSETEPMNERQEEDEETEDDSSINH